MSRARAYRLIANELRQRVQSGTQAPGSRMPSLREIEGEFGVSHITARAAYQVLTGEGLVESRFGGGHYVRIHRPIIPHGIQRLAQDPRTAGLAIGTASPTPARNAPPSGNDGRQQTGSSPLSAVRVRNCDIFSSSQGLVR